MKNARKYRFFILIRVTTSLTRKMCDLNFFTLKQSLISYIY